MPRLALAGASGERGCRRCARPGAWTQARTADRRPATAAPRGAEAGRARDTSRSAEAGTGTADPGLVRQLQERHLGARRLALHRLSRRRQRCHGLGRNRHSQPRAETFAAPARRQGGGARPGVRLRCLRAGCRLDRRPWRRTGQPGRGAFGRTRAGAADRPADGQARARARAPSAAAREPSARARERVGRVRRSPEQTASAMELPSRVTLGLNACSTGPKRSTSSTRRPKACRAASCGGAPSTTSRGSKGRSGSRPNGGGSRRPRGCAIIIASRTRPAAATGSTAKALIGDGRGGAPNGSSTGLFG